MSLLLMDPSKICSHNAGDTETAFETSHSNVVPFARNVKARLSRGMTTKNAAV
jgi:hypothetical protein